MPELILLVLAAGIGRRFQGLKQIESVGPSGEIMLDYAVHDALRAGFRRLVFVITRDIEPLFRESTGYFWEQQVPVSYVYQEIDSPLAAGPDFLPERRKPWGTAQAVLLCRTVINAPFAVINADDFYGRGAFRALGDWLRSRLTGPREAMDEYGFVGYRLKKTLSEHGYVSRGICSLDGDGYLREVIERVKIERTDDGARAELDSGRWLTLTGDEIASMNFWGFTPGIFGKLETGFAEFLKTSGRDPNAEYYLPTAVNDLIASGKARVKHIPAEDAWFGLTYPGDLGRVRSHIRELVGQGVYPGNLKKGGSQSRA